MSATFECLLALCQLACLRCCVADGLADSVVVAPLLLATLTASAQALLELTRQTMVGTQCRALLCSLHSKASPFLQWSVCACVRVFKNACAPACCASSSRCSGPLLVLCEPFYVFCAVSCVYMWFDVAILPAFTCRSCSSCSSHSRRPQLECCAHARPFSLNQ